MIFNLKRKIFANLAEDIINAGGLQDKDGKSMDKINTFIKSVAGNQKHEGYTQENERQANEFVKKHLEKNGYNVDDVLTSLDPKKRKSYDGVHEGFSLSLKRKNKQRHLQDLNNVDENIKKNKIEADNVVSSTSKSGKSDNFLVADGKGLTDDPNYTYAVEKNSSKISDNNPRKTATELEIEKEKVPYSKDPKVIGQEIPDKAKIGDTFNNTEAGKRWEKYSQKLKDNAEKTARKKASSESYLRHAAQRDLLKKKKMSNILKKAGWVTLGTGVAAGTAAGISHLLKKGKKDSPEHRTETAFDRNKNLFN